MIDKGIYDINGFQIRFFTEKEIQDLASEGGFKIVCIIEEYEESVTIYIVSSRKTWWNFLYANLCYYNSFCLVREGKRGNYLFKIRAEVTIIITYNLVTRIVRLLWKLSVWIVVVIQKSVWIVNPYMIARIVPQSNVAVVLLSMNEYVNKWCLFVLLENNLMKQNGKFL